MKSVESAKGRVVCRRFLAAVSLLGLSGCVSAVTDDEMAAAPPKAGNCRAAEAQRQRLPPPPSRPLCGIAVASAAGAAATPAHPQVLAPRLRPMRPPLISAAWHPANGDFAGTTSIYSSAAPPL